MNQASLGDPPGKTSDTRAAVSLRPGRIVLGAPGTADSGTAVNGYTEPPEPQACVKCGHLAIAIAWHRTMTDCPYSERLPAGTGEHLHRTCLTCGYYWPEPPLDAA